MKIIVYQDQIEHYRIPFWIETSKEVELTLASRNNPVISKKIRSKKLNVFTFFKKFRFYLLFDFKPYDKIVIPFDLNILNLYYLVFSQSRTKIFLWGIGVSSSSRVNFLRFILAKRFAGLIVYEEKAYRYWRYLGIKNVYYKGNTVSVDKIDISQRKFKHLLICGSLDERKRVGDILGIAAKINIPVIVIGDGVMRNNLESKYTCNVQFLGKITDKIILKKYFLNTIATVHPGQAGLAVLNSMGHGVPFICYTSAISGGEIGNIISGLNGYKVKNKLELEILIDSLNSNHKLLKKISNNSFEYYWKHRSIERMTQRFLKLMTK